MSHLISIWLSTYGLALTVCDTHAKKNENDELKNKI